MQSSFSKTSQFTLISDAVTKFAYQRLKQQKSFVGLVNKAINNHLSHMFALKTQNKTQLISSQTLLEIEQRINQLGKTDLQDSHKEVYPVDLLFDNPWQNFFRFYPDVWTDLAYLRDLQIETLFDGVADSMRRRILAPLKQGLSVFSSMPSEQIKVLDIGCGMGQTLKFIRATLPEASLFGVDLSIVGLHNTKKLFSEHSGELPQLTHANAEDLPYPDNYFHGVSNVFLFHELPASARQQVIEECFRVTKPGGIVTICDSMQIFDFPEFEILMKNYFPAMFNESYRQDYIQDNLVERLEKAGFEKIETENHFFSKYWIARKPEGANTEKY